MRTFRPIATLIMLSSVISCGKRSPLDAHGINLIEIRMEGDLVGEVLRGAREKIEYPAQVKINGVTYPILLQPAGASTITQAKKSWDLKFTQKNPYGAKQLRLASTISDRSMLRALLALDVFKAAGFNVSSIQPSFVYLNDIVLGLYYNIERIDEDFFKKRKINWRRYYEAVGSADFAPEMEVKLDRAFSGKPEPANLEVMGVITRLLKNTPNDAEFENQIFQIMDRESVVNYLVGTLITRHFDGYKKNLYYYEETGDAHLKLLPWDFDLDWYDFNSSNFTPAVDPVKAPWAGSVLFARLYGLNSVKIAVDTKTATLVAGSCSYANLKISLDRHQAIIDHAYQYDPRMASESRSLAVEANLLAQAISDWLSSLTNF